MLKYVLMQASNKLKHARKMIVTYKHINSVLKHVSNMLTCWKQVLLPQMYIFFIFKKVISYSFVFVFDLKYYLGIFLTDFVRFTQIFV